MSWVSADKGIFGGILPFIGWRTPAIGNDGDLVDPTKPDFNPNADYTAESVLMFCWFNYCIVVRPFWRQS